MSIKVVGPWELKPIRRLLSKPSRVGPVAWSGVTPIPKAAGVGAEAAGTAWLFALRCNVKRNSLSRFGVKVRI